MNNVSVKTRLIINISLCIIILLGILILYLNDKLTFSILAFFAIAICFFLFLFFSYFSCCDIYINNKNDTIKIKKIFGEKDILLSNFIVNDHYGYDGQSISAFILYTNNKKIKINYTQKNYDTLLLILKLINYKYYNKFINDVEKRLSIIDFESAKLLP